jgi:tRNA nucleotidyltransferase/poly(A) polymerase
MEFYEVGGCVRDEILGAPSKDIDFSVVMESEDVAAYSAHNRFTPYEYMVFYLEGLGVKVIRGNDEKPVGADFLTARGIAPKDFPLHPNRALDFVLARRESDYTDGRRPDKVEVGTLYDDLARRDFTMNAIAKDMDGSLIDPFNGQADIAAGIIRAVGDPYERLAEDALRAVRALRFSVTKNFSIEKELREAMEYIDVLDAIVQNISDERIQQEISKMFRYHTIGSLYRMAEFPVLTRAIFSGSVSLDATMKTKGRGK